MYHELQSPLRAWFSVLSSVRDRLLVPVQNHQGVSGKVHVVRVLGSLRQPSLQRSRVVMPPG